MAIREFSNDSIQYRVIDELTRAGVIETAHAAIAIRLAQAMDRPGVADYAYSGLSRALSAAIKEALAEAPAANDELTELQRRRAERRNTA